MTNLLEIKPYIHDFVEEHLDVSFANKVYWIGERKNIPSYPYCLLNVISENKDKTTSTSNRNLLYDTFREVTTTLYKNATITIGVYNAWIEDTYSELDMDEANEFAYQQINFLEECFETRENQEEFYPIFSIKNISPIRPLPEVVDGGYMYRYEFDLTVGYDEHKTDNFEIGKIVGVQMYDTKLQDDVAKVDFEIEDD